MEKGLQAERSMGEDQSTAFMVGHTEKDKNYRMEIILRLINYLVKELRED